MGKSAKPVVGIDLGGTNIQIGVVTPEFKIVGRSRKKTKADEGREAVLTRLAEGIKEACSEAGLAPSALGGIGLAAPGAIDPRKGLVLEAVNLRWTNQPVAKQLSDRLAGLPVLLDNDVNAAVLGENRLGAGDNAQHLLGVWLGTGIGGGLILNGALYYGHYFSAGEIGHTILFPGSPPGSRTLEHNCSRTAVADRLARLIRSNRKSILTDLSEGDLDKIRSKAISKAYESGDDLTVEIIHNAADLLGIAVANAVTLLSLPRVVLGGGLTEAIGEPLVKRVRQSFEKHVFPDACRDAKIVASKLEDDAGLLGAAILAAEKFG